MENFIRSLLEDIRKVKEGGILKIFTGEASPVVYNNREVARALTELKKRGAKLSVCVSSIYVTDNEGENKLIALADKICYRERREVAVHYRIIDNPGEKKTCYAESPHRVLALQEEREPVTFKDKDECNFWAEKLDNDFEIWDKESKKDITVQPLTQTQMEKLLNTLKESGDYEGFDFLDYNALKVRLEEILK